MTAPAAKFGLQILPAGKRRSDLIKAFETVLADEMGRRVALFDSIAGQDAAELVASQPTKRRPMELRDTMTAAIVLACHATLAMWNMPHFGDLPVPAVNPCIS